MAAKADFSVENEALVPFDNISSDKHSLSLTTAPVVARFLHGIEKGKFTARQVENVRSHKHFGPILSRLQVSLHSYISNLTSMCCGWSIHMRPHIPPCLWVRYAHLCLL